MADTSHDTDGPSPYSQEGYDPSLLPDFSRQFISEEHVRAFELALSAPEPSPSTDDLLCTNGLTSPAAGSQTNLQATRSRDARGNTLKSASQTSLFITAQNDWAPVNRKVRSHRRRGESEKGGRRKKRKSIRPPRRSKDETREGYLYTLLKWPLLALVSAWVTGLGTCYLLTRLYIWLYEYFIAWRGERLVLKSKLQSTTHYGDWVQAAEELDRFLGNDRWKENPQYAYYDHKTIQRVLEHIRMLRRRAEEQERAGTGNGGKNNMEELKGLIEACVKNNFVGVENPRLYGQTYYGTKHLVQEFVDEVEKGVTLLAETTQLPIDEKATVFKRMQKNYGRTALCLSGGASFAYYHLGVVKGLLDADLLPDVITGTSGGALVAALVATRTNDELKALLVPALADKIDACSEPIKVWGPRWWKTGARFDSVDWARRCSWFCRGSMTFREAYERTGRILNVSCVPSDPHSPTILTNYITSPECVIWSAVLASAAVPSILNPVVLMMKNKDGTLSPYSFGHKWKDGSLRTDIPLKSLNLQFNVNFSIVSQVNPHINLFFFSSRGSVGQPVTHRKGRGWRGGFVGSATEQYIKLDLNKWLKVLRHLELLPRPLGQDWSEIWLQQFSGTITIWPRSQLSDFWRILSDPDPPRLAQMLHVGQQSVFPKLKFIANRMKVERAIEKGRRETTPTVRRGSLQSILSEDDLRGLMITSGQGSESGMEDDTDLTTYETGDEFEDSRNGSPEPGARGLAAELNTYE